MQLVLFKYSPRGKKDFHFISSFFFLILLGQDPHHITNNDGLFLYPHPAPLKMLSWFYSHPFTWKEKLKKKMEPSYVCVTSDANVLPTEHERAISYFKANKFFFHEVHQIRVAFAHLY